MSDKYYPETRILLSDTSDLTHLEFRVLIHYAKHMDDKTLTTFVSQSTIAKKCGIERYSANKAVASLVDKGYLMYLPKKGRSNVMKLIFKGKENETMQTNKKRNDNGGSKKMSYGLSDERNVQDEKEKQEVKKEDFSLGKTPYNAWSVA